MTTTVHPVVATHRPASVIASVVLLGVLAVTAIAGGIALAANTGAAPAEEWLEDIPLIDSWLIPGLVLAIGFGIGSAITAYGIVRRPRWTWLGWLERLTAHHWSWPATGLIGLGHIVWIGLELVYLPELSVLQAFYGALGVALLLLPFAAGMRSYLGFTD
jgi:hypothetical protein